MLGVEKNKPVINNKVGGRELVRVEQEWRDTQRQNRNPEVCDPTCPERQSDIEQHHQGPHSEIDTRAGEAGVEDAERDARCCETTTRRDVPRATECQVGQNRVSIDLCRENFEDRRERGELLGETVESLACAALNEFCKGISAMSLRIG